MKHLKQLNSLSNEILSLYPMFIFSMTLIVPLVYNDFISTYFSDVI